MRYIMFMIPAVYASDAEEAMPSAEMVEKMMAYNAALSEAGVLVSLDGLHPPASAVRLEFGESGSRQLATQQQGAIGGYWVLTVDSHEAAVEWARRVPAAPGDVIEVRRIQEMTDFPDDVQDVVKAFDL